MYEQFDFDLSAPLSPKVLAELDALEAQTDRQIDTSDIPVLPESAWEDAIRNPCMNPDQKLTHAMVDNDVLDWLKSDGPGYRIRINTLLREAMLRAKAPQSEGQQAQTVDTAQQAA